MKEAGGAVIDTSGGMLVLLSDLKNNEVHDYTIIRPSDN